PAFAGATFENGTDIAGNRGVIVSEIEAGSPALRFGLRKDDVIIGVNRQRVNTIIELTDRMENADGQVTAINVRRGESTLYLVIR
ncbi:MAG: PDZ domain-containing protein, partial [Glaciecola sp.]